MTDETHRREQELLAAQLAKDPDFRVLRRVPEPHLALAEEMPANGQIVAIVDCETTGLHSDRDEIIELAILNVILDENDEVIGHITSESWIEEPQWGLHPHISRLTGLTEDMLSGQQINDARAVGLLERADMIIAHNAKFDAAFVEHRLPSIAGKNWACSCSEINWADLGLEGRSQGYLLAQHGWFANAHRAADDAWSLLHLLRERRDGETHLQRLLRTAGRTSFRIEATGAHYEHKDRLKSSDYRWDASAKVWWKEVEADALAHEKEWLETMRVFQPMVHTLTASNRHRLFKPIWTCNGFVPVT